MFLHILNVLAYIIYSELEKNAFGNLPILNPLPTTEKKKRMSYLWKILTWF